MSKPFTNNAFLNHIRIVNSGNYVYGNEVLYSSFNFSILPTPNSPKPDCSKLSSAIWLIGKSYSADPMRSSGTHINNSGLGLSFDFLSRKIVTDPNYAKLYQLLLQLHTQHFSYNFSTDRTILDKTIYSVNLLNTIIKNSMGKGSHNTISFCSKFLHFMCPNVFFIIDSYSLSGGISLFNGRINHQFQIDSIPSIDWIDIDRNARTYFSKYFSQNVSSINLSHQNSIKQYSKHCLRAYSLAHFLNQNQLTCIEQIKNCTSSTYMPRLVDSILMRIK